jgi:hypothetical protein
MATIAFAKFAYNHVSGSALCITFMAAHVCSTHWRRV